LADKLFMMQCNEHATVRLADCPTCRALDEFERTQARLRELGRLVNALIGAGQVEVLDVEAVR
jgi:hypothetical protein